MPENEEAPTLYLYKVELVLGAGSDTYFVVAGGLDEAAAKAVEKDESYTSDGIISAYCRDIRCVTVMGVAYDILVT